MSFAKAVLLAGALVAATGLAFFGYAKYRLATVRVTEVLAVNVEAPGLSATSVEAELTAPLEQALASLPGLESLRSVSRAGAATIELRVTTFGVEATPASILVRERLEAVQRQLPEGATAPWLTHHEPGQVTRHFVARSDTLTRLDLSRWLDEELRREVEVQQGVRAVRLCGAVEPVLEVSLDVPRLSALHLSASEVVEVMQAELPTGFVPRGRVLGVRVEELTLERLQELQLKDGVRLSDVATLSLEGRRGDCVTQEGVLVSVDLFAQGTLEPLPSHPAVKLVELKPARTATYLTPPGTSVEQALTALRLPGAFVTAEGEVLRAYLADDAVPPPVPGLALRELDERHVVVRVSGPDFEKLVELGGRLGERLAKHPDARWVGAAWPGLGVEQRVNALSDRREVAKAVELALGGKFVGSLEDRTRVRVRAGRTLEEAFLPDGRPVTQVAELTVESVPAALLHVNTQRTVELKVAMEAEKAQQAIAGVPLPAGYMVTIEP